MLRVILDTNIYGSLILEKDLKRITRNIKDIAKKTFFE